MLGENSIDAEEFCRRRLIAARHEVTGLLAYHFGQAASLGHQLDHTDPGLSQRAFEVLADAGRQARRRDSLQDAERWLGQARPRAVG